MIPEKSINKWKVLILEKSTDIWKVPIPEKNWYVKGTDTQKALILENYWQFWYLRSIDTFHTGNALILLMFETFWYLWYLKEMWNPLSLQNIDTLLILRKSIDTFDIWEYWFFWYFIDTFDTYVKGLILKTCWCFKSIDIFKV